MLREWPSLHEFDLMLRNLMSFELSPFARRLPVSTNGRGSTASRCAPVFGPSLSSQSISWSVPCDRTALLLLLWTAPAFSFKTFLLGSSPRACP